MTKYVALLRGINVGGNSKVEMVRLRSVFAALGYTDVSTYINSGNVLFATDKKYVLLLTGAIEHALKKEFGFPISVLLRDEKTLRKVAAAIPTEWVNDLEQKADVLFLWGAFDRKQTLALLPTNPAVDRVHYVAGSIIWSVDRKDYKQSGMQKFIGTDVYKHMTARNVNTVRKLVELLGGPKVIVPKRTPIRVSPDVDSVEAYIENALKEVQPLLRSIRATIAAAAPSATETFSYGMPTFDLGGKHLVHFAAFAKHIGFYPTPSAILAFQKELVPYKTSKGAVQFPLSAPLPERLITRMVRFRVKEEEGRKKGKGKIV